MPIDDRTTNRSYQLPNAGNQLSDDVARLRAALQAIDADVFARYTKAEVDQKLADLINGAPGALDTLNELAEAMGDDPNFAATVTNALALKANAANVYAKSEADTLLAAKAPLASPTFTGTPAGPTAGPDTNTTQLATTAFVIAQAYLKSVTAASTYAALVGATFTGGITVPSLNGGPLSGMRNRIINGDMRIDQRRNGGTVGTGLATTRATAYSVDRWMVQKSVSGKLNGGRNYNAVTPPAGFTHYLGVQSQSAYSVAAADYFTIMQPIEGNNIADLAWGSADAVPVVLSFRVRSSLTGTFGGSLKNSAQDRSYPFTYQISQANTWTTISVAISGPTSGTWLTDTGVGAVVTFGLGVGSTYSGTAGVWTNGNLMSATGAVSVVGTSSATFQITGVQLEAGVTATPFERRGFAQELQLCQRYYEKSYDLSAVGVISTDAGLVGGQTFYQSGAVAVSVPAPSIAFKVRKRSYSYDLFIYDRSGTENRYSSYANGVWSNSTVAPTILQYGETSFTVYPGATSATMFFHYIVNDELL